MTDEIDDLFGDETVRTTLEEHEEMLRRDAEAAGLDEDTKASSKTPITTKASDDEPSDDADESSEDANESSEDADESSEDADESSEDADESSDDSGDADESSDDDDESSDDADDSGDGDETSDDVPESADADVPAAAKSASDDDDDDDDETGETGDDVITVSYYGMTDVGLIREHNEDNLVMVDLEAEVRGVPENEPRNTVVGPRGLTLTVCDGMGGAAAGEVASQLAVDTVAEILQSGSAPTDRDMFAHRLVFSIEEAGARIFGSARADRTRRGMGTTATVAGLIDKVLFVGQVGDSRCYVLRNGELALITKDQSLVNQLIEAGQLTEEEAETFEHSNIILQALGTTEEISVDLTFVELRRGDRVMLCSDGLSGLVHNEMIQEVMQETESLVEVSRQLIDMANAGGGHDNITCIVADFGGPGLDPAEGATTPRYVQYPLPAMSAEEDDVTSSGAHRRPTPPPDDDVLAAAPHPDRMSLWPFLLALVLAGGIAAYFLTRPPRPDGFGAGEGQVQPEIEPEIEPVEPEVEHQEPALAQVTVATDIANAELFVDGQSHGPMRRTARVELEEGAYRFEIRVGGSSLVSELVTVEDGILVELMLPSIEPPDMAEPDESEVDVEAEEPVDPIEPDISPMIPTMRAEVPTMVPMVPTMVPTMTQTMRTMRPSQMRTNMTRMTAMEADPIPDNPF